MSNKKGPRRPLENFADFQHEANKLVVMSRQESEDRKRKKQKNAS